MFSKKTPTEKAAVKRRKEHEREVLKRKREEAKRAEERRLEAEAFAKSPPGRARFARESGANLFQIELPLSETKANVIAMVGAFSKTERDEQHATVLDSIEAEGWRLEHANYVYQIEGSESRDKFMKSGQQEAFKGKIIGIYIFRAVANDQG